MLRRMTAPFIITGPAGGSTYATAPTITAALAVARAQGGSVVLAAGAYDEDVVLLPGDSLKAAGPGVTIRGEACALLSPTDTRSIVIQDVTLEAAPGQTTAALAVKGASAVGRVNLLDCKIRGESTALEVTCAGSTSAPPSVALVDCYVVSTAPNVPAMILGGPNVHYRLLETKVSAHEDALGAVYVAPSPATPFEMVGCELAGSLSIDDSGLAAGQLAGTVRGCHITESDPAGAIYASQGVGCVVMLEGTTLDAGDAFSANGLVVRARGEVGVTLASRLGTALGSGSEALPSARARTSTWFGPGGTPIVGNTIQLADFVDLVVVDTSAQGIAPVATRLPPLAEQWDGHVVEVKNLGGTPDLVVSPYDTEKLDGVPSGVHMVNAGGSARFFAARARSTWVRLS